MANSHSTSTCPWWRGAMLVRMMSTNVVDDRLLDRPNTVLVAGPFPIWPLE